MNGQYNIPTSNEFLSEEIPRSDLVLTQEAEPRDAQFAPYKEIERDIEDMRARAAGRQYQT